MSKPWTSEEVAIAERVYHDRNYAEVSDKLAEAGFSRTATAVEKFIRYSPKWKRDYGSWPVPLKPRIPVIKPPARVLVYGDVHYPFQDNAAVAIMLEVAKDFDPKMIIVNGDLLDNFETSHFVRKTPNFVDMREEVEMGKQHFRVLRARHPKAEIWFNESNHEFRFISYIAEHAPALLPFAINPDGSPGPMSLAAMLELGNLGIHFNPCINGESYIDLGNILVGHWRKYSKHASFTAKHLIEDLGISLIQGHVHHMGTFTKTWVRREVVGYEGGCLCSLTPQYTINPNWQQGFDLIYFHDEFFQVQPIKIVKTAEGYIFAMFGSKMYKKRIAA